METNKVLHMLKKIRGSYYIADCEHRGDVSRSEAFLRSLGCEVIGSYWDGVDCGEAHTDFYVSECRFVPLYYRLGHSCSFDADINDYLRFEDDLPYRMMSEGEFLGLKESMSEEEAREYIMSTPIELELYYSPSYGCFAVESDAVDGGCEIYDPYTGEACEGYGWE